MDTNYAPVPSPEEPNRRSANFPPCVWGDFFLQYDANSEEIFAEERLEHERVKEGVKKMLRSDENGWQKLELIDTIQRLGISYNFQTEIEAILEQEDDSDNDDLQLVALRFRLRRQLGHRVSCDVFEKFKDPDGNFKESLSNNTKGLLSLYEAANFMVHEEHILKEALNFTISKLQAILSNIDNLFLASKINQALEMPIQKAMPRIEARKFISFYEGDESHDEDLLRFAKLDFNMVQRIHQKELSTLTKWWKGIDCPKKFPFARDRLVETYYLSWGTYFEPEYSFARIASTKVINLTTIFDDIYDVHGTYDELILFTDSIQRWDLRASAELPPYMQHFYGSLLDAYSEIEEMLAQNGKLELLEYAISSYKELSKMYFEEAKWIESGYIPNYDEYMKIAEVSFACDMSSIICLVCLGQSADQQCLDWYSKRPLLLRASDLMSRLMDDIASHEVFHLSAYSPSNFARMISIYFS